MDIIMSELLLEIEARERASAVSGAASQERRWPHTSNSCDTADRRLTSMLFLWSRSPCRVL